MLEETARDYWGVNSFFERSLDSTKASIMATVFHQDFIKRDGHLEAGRVK